MLLNSIHAVLENVMNKGIKNKRRSRDTNKG